MYTPIHGELCFRVLAADCGRYGNSWGSGRSAINDDFTRLYALADGACRIVHDGSTHQLQPGRIHLIPGGIHVGYRCERSMVLHWLHLRIEAGPGLDLLAGIGRPRRSSPMPEAADRLAQVIHALQIETPRSLLRATAGIGEILTDLIGDDWQPLLPDLARQQRFAPILASIAEAPERPLALSRLAALADLHPTYLSNRFRAVFGQTPLQYQTGLRLRKAKQRLLAGESVNAVAASCGYEDPFYFSRLFRRHVGIPPSRYREIVGRRMGNPSD